MATLYVCILTQVILLLLLCPGALGACNEPSHLDVTTPGSLEALNGSCVQIPCSFSPVGNFQVSVPVVGVWIITNHNFDRHPKNVIFNSSACNNCYPMTITGDLKKKNCTTLFNNLTTEYSKTYYFRIENGPGYLATAACDPLQITVKDAPWSPSIEVSGDQSESEVVTLTCSAVTPCPHAPPQLKWDLHQGTVNITETNRNGTVTTKSNLTITLTDSHNGKVIKCSAAYPVNGGVKMADRNVTLNVTYGPKDTSVRVSPSGSLSAGQSVTLSCSSRANPPVQSFTWFRHSSQGPAFVSDGHTYNLTFTEDEDYYCVASNGLRNESSPVTQLKIEEPLPWEVIVGAGFGFLVLLCLAVFVWYFRSKRQASRETQGETFEEATKAEEEENIHYGEIDFSKLTPKVVRDTTEQEETVYAQVQVSKPETTQPTEDLDELYAKVEK